MYCPIGFNVNCRSEISLGNAMIKPIDSADSFVKAFEISGFRGDQVRQAQLSQLWLNHLNASIATAWRSGQGDRNRLLRSVATRSSLSGGRGM